MEEEGGIVLWRFHRVVGSELIGMQGGFERSLWRKQGNFEEMKVDFDGGDDWKKRG